VFAAFCGLFAAPVRKTDPEKPPLSVRCAVVRPFSLNAEFKVRFSIRSGRPDLSPSFIQVQVESVRHLSLADSPKRHSAVFRCGEVARAAAVLNGSDPTDPQASNAGARPLSRAVPAEPTLRGLPLLRVASARSEKYVAAQDGSDANVRAHGSIRIALAFKRSSSGFDSLSTSLSVRAPVRAP
jgi:hypothetical protein